MKKIQPKIIGLCLLALSVNMAQAQTTLIHYWNFNSVTAAHNPTIPVIHASYSTIDTNKANVVYKLTTGASATYAGYIDNVAGDTLNARMSAAAGQGLRVRNPSDSMELRVYAPTNGYYGNIAIKYEVQSSSVTSGQLAQLFDYSVDSGATWKTTGLNMTIDSISQAQFQGTSWGLVSLNFNNDTAVRNNARFIFRIRFAGNTAMTSGNNRFDNMTVESVPVPQGISNVPGEQQTVIYPNPASGSININTNSDVNKTVAIYNAAGQRVFVTATNEKSIQIATGEWATGVYYTYITTGSRTEVRSFIKQ